jgi:hypothetical protein
VNYGLCVDERGACAIPVCGAAGRFLDAVEASDNALVIATR